MKTIAVIGGGKIGESLIVGLIKNGHNPKDIRVTNRNAERGHYLKETYQVQTSQDNAAVVDDADFVFLCVKPKQSIAVVEEIASVIDNNDSTILVSMAAGISTAKIEEILAVGAPVVRVMPNTPMLVGQGMSALSAGKFVSKEQLSEVVDLLSSVGKVRIVDETDMDAVTAMSGSSPAYLFFLSEALIDAGVNLGLTRSAARELSVQALYGAATMLAETDEEPVILRANVSSPAGATVAAIREFEESGLRGAVYRATHACAERSAELGK
ncbi:Pyrroline-5-carboxylate reductase [Corynebacterium kutscheri]|uniref:Pyrroline-5-carboxylate reductase n=1 Tax=Corynebacterium kutscheri TaxID=35755 RepID=A0A0F6QYC0_9CORY|nr:pyrroline-5-carboxylate reductase [Corynebacterium kutscheri]AKE40477.1 pyrroline-5-carboxylate reductase [Corynebacterium kutscheri]VEH05127.1 Pyrroline-5-carboxylate reductase [Corynebacterium kutscheri]VEH10871.1 Pyrroline-5-carboxylate reductase [Corynebacterium kutscheri]VEH80652.1 Pyrroline-5-carboxylate reductase [Corynebacterium kutscheri]